MPTLSRTAQDVNATAPLINDRVEALSSLASSERGWTDDDLEDATPRHVGEERTRRTSFIGGIYNRASHHIAEKMESWADLPADILKEEQIMERERIVIQARRHSCLESESDPVAHGCVGLCCSGGGVRSAAFAAGALTSLAEAGALKHVDFVSSVSGGGFTALSYMTHLKGMVPTPAEQMPGGIDSYYKRVVAALVQRMTRNAGYLFRTGPGCLGWMTGLYHVLVLVAVALAVLSNLVRFFFLSFPLALLLDKIAGEPLREYMDSHDHHLRANDGVLLLFLVPLIAFGTLLIGQCVASLLGGRGQGFCNSIEKCSTVLLSVVGAFIVIFAVVVVSLLMYTLDARHFFIIIAYFVVFLMIIFHLSRSASHLPLFVVPFAILLLVANTTRWRVMRDHSWLLGYYNNERFDVFYYVAVGGLILFTVPGHPLSYSKVVSLTGRLFRQRLYRAFFYQGEDVNLGKAAEGIKFEAVASQDYGTTSPMNESARLYQPVFLTNAVAHAYRNPEVMLLGEDKLSYFSFTFSQVAAGSYRTGYLPVYGARDSSKLGPCYPNAQVTASYAMTASAAALAVHNGDYDKEGFSSFIFSLFNIGLGDWFEFHTLSHHGKFGYTLCVVLHLVSLLLLLFAQIFELPSMLYIGYSLVLLLLLSVFTRMGAVSLYSFPVRQVAQSLGAVWENKRPPPLLYLSDGGHIENLGLVELLRRCCSHIVVVDSMAADDHWHPFCQLQVAMERARSGIRSSVQELSTELTGLDKPNDIGEDRNKRHMIRCSFHPPAEVDDKVDVEQYLEAMLDAPYVQLRVSYHNDRGKLIGSGVIYYIRLQGVHGCTGRGTGSTVLPGICCECCHGLSWTRLFGEFPKHGTASQFFTPPVFNAYVQSGEHAVRDAVQDLLKGIKECDVLNKTKKKQGPGDQGVNKVQVLVN